MKNTTMPVYIGAKGNMFTENEIENAHLIISGMRREEDEDLYCGFKEYLFMNGSLVDTQYPSVEELLKMGRNVLATKLYREQNGCLLSEAHKAICELRAHMEMLNESKEGE